MYLYMYTIRLSQMRSIISFQRDVIPSFEDLLDLGIPYRGYCNFVASGWSPSDNQEIMSLPELVEKFDYHHMSKSPAVFDFTKLNG